MLFNEPLVPTQPPTPAGQEMSAGQRQWQCYAAGRINHTSGIVPAMHLYILWDVSIYELNSLRKGGELNIPLALL